MRLAPITAATVSPPSEACVCGEGGTVWTTMGGLLLEVVLLLLGWVSAAAQGRGE